MSILAKPSFDALANALEAFKSAEVRKQAVWVESLLSHRSVLVRRAAAEALGRARLGGPCLRQRLREEKNILVITEITESLAGIGDKDSLSQLYELAEDHSSTLVRSYAILAIADILRRAAVPYLSERRIKEKSRRVKASLNYALFVHGAREVLPALLRDLASGDFKIRSLVTNLLFDYTPSKERSLLRGALREAMVREENPGVRGDMQRAIAELSPD